LDKILPLRHRRNRARQTVLLAKRKNHVRRLDPLTNRLQKIPLILLRERRVLRQRRQQVRSVRRCVNPSFFRIEPAQIFFVLQINSPLPQPLSGTHPHQNTSLPPPPPKPKNAQPQKPPAKKPTPFLPLQLLFQYSPATPLPAPATHLHSKRPAAESMSPKS